MAAKKKTPKKPPRQIMQIATGPVPDSHESGAGTFHQIYALCNDGTVWANTLEQNGWYSLPEVPQGETYI